MKIRLFALVMAMLLTAWGLSACKKDAETLDSTVSNEQTAPVTEDEPKPEDTTDYAALLAFQFEGLTDSPASEFDYTEKNGGVMITDYLGTAEKVCLPNTIAGLPVTAIGDGAFAELTNLKVLSLPDSVTEFGTGILTGCSALYALRTPLPTADGTAFLGYLYGAESYETNNMPDLRHLEFLELGGSLTELPSYALYDCNDLVAVKLPETVTSLAAYSLYRCESLKYINTENLTVLAPHAMDFCLGLEKLELSASLQSIGLGALENCNALRRLTLPFIGESRDGNSYLGYIFGAADYGFSAGFYPPSLEFVTVTEGADKVGDHAFYDCDSLRSVVLPGSVTAIGTRAFSGCVKLKELQLPDGVTTVGDSAFSGCTALASIGLGTSLRSLGVNAFLNCTALTSITLPASLTVLPNSCFYGCTSLKTVDMGGVTTIGTNAFYGCTSLEGQD